MINALRRTLILLCIPFLITFAYGDDTPLSSNFPASVDSDAELGGNLTPYANARTTAAVSCTNGTLLGTSIPVTNGSIFDHSGGSGVIMDSSGHATIFTYTSVNGNAFNGVATGPPINPVDLPTGTYSVACTAPYPVDSRVYTLETTDYEGALINVLRKAIQSAQRYIGVVGPGVAPSAPGSCVFDSTSNSYKCQFNGGAKTLATADQIGADAVLTPTPGKTPKAYDTGKIDKGWVPDMTASGSTHTGGLVPDPGATPLTDKFLAADATFKSPLFADEVDSSTCTGGTLTGCIADIGSNTRTLIIRGNMKRGANVTLPSNITLDFTRGTGTLDCESTVGAITIQGPIIVSRTARQIFNGCGSGNTTTPVLSFAGNNFVNRLETAWFGDVGANVDGVVNTQPFIRDANLAATTFPNGGVIHTGPGVHNLTAAYIPWGDNVTWEGDGVSTVILTSVSNAIGNTSTKTSKSFRITNMLIRNVIGGINFNNTISRLEIDHVIFDLTTGSANGVFSVGIPQMSIHDNYCYGDGDGNGTCISISTDGNDITIENNRCEFLRQCVTVSATQTNAGLQQRAIRINNNQSDQGWPIAKAICSGFGTYTATSVTDPTMACPALLTSNVIRVLSPRFTAGAAATYANNTIVDAAALNVTNGVTRGDIVRSPIINPTKFTTVIKVQNETTVAVDQWRDINTYRPVSAPATNDPYITYGFVVAASLAQTPTTTININANGWGSWYGDTPTGKTPTPAAGTIYEVMVSNTLQSIFIDIPDLEIEIGGNYVRRGYATQVAVQGASRTNVHDNTIEDGYGIGINFSSTSTNNIAHNNTIVHQGNDGILLSASYSIVQGNMIIDPGWQPEGNIATTTISGIDVRGTGNILKDNIIDKGAALFPSKGIALVAGPIQNEIISGNATRGFDSTNPGFYPTSGINATGTVIGPNKFDFVGTAFLLTGGIWQDTGSLAYTALTALVNAEDGSRLWVTGTDGSCSGVGTVNQYCFKQGTVWKPQGFARRNELASGDYTTLAALVAAHLAQTPTGTPPVVPSQIAIIDTSLTYSANITVPPTLTLDFRGGRLNHSGTPIATLQGNIIASESAQIFSDCARVSFAGNTLLRQVSVGWCGAKGDGNFVHSGAAMTGGGSVTGVNDVVTLPAGPVTFSAANLGQAISVYGAGTGGTVPTVGFICATGGVIDATHASLCSTATGTTPVYAVTTVPNTTALGAARWGTSSSTPVTNLSAAVDGVGLTVFFPPGKYYNDVSGCYSLKASNVRYLGANSKASIIMPAGNVCGQAFQVTSTGGINKNHITVENLGCVQRVGGTFCLNFQSTFTLDIRVLNNSADLTEGGTFVTVQTDNTKVLYNECYSLKGVSVGTCVSILNSANDVEVAYNRCWLCNTLVNMNTVAVTKFVRNVNIHHNYSNAQIWWQAGVAEGGVNATYDATHLNDSGSPFVGTAAIADIVRVEQPLASNLTGTGVTYTVYELADTSANFTTAGVVRQDVVRVAGASATVLSVVDATHLQLGVWMDSVTRYPVAAPVAATPYTVYHTSWGMVNGAVAAGVVTVYRWAKWDGSTEATPPAAGSSYYFILGSNAGSAIQASLIGGQVENTAISDNTLVNGYSDQISVKGLEGLRIDGNIVEDGGDTGITAWGYGVQILNNKIKHQRVCGIIYTMSTANNTARNGMIANNSIQDASWNYATGGAAAAISTSGMNRTLITNNLIVVEKNAATAQGWGILINHASTDTADSNVIAENVIYNTPQGGIWLNFISGGAGPSNTWIRGNSITVPGGAPTITDAGIGTRYTNNVINGVLQSIGSPGGGYVSDQQVTVLTASITGASPFSVAGLIPAGGVQVTSMSCYVNTIIGGAGITTVDIGVSGATDRYCNDLPVAATSVCDLTNFAGTGTGPTNYSAATNILVTANGGATFSGTGKLRCTAFYRTLGAPTS